MLNISLGIWLTHVTGSAAWSALILGSFYFLLALLAITPALRWLKKLQS
jgi:hypothetical protein